MLAAAANFSLSGKLALITGSSRGIGKTLAWGLAAAGARVCLNGLNSEQLKSTAAEFRAAFEGPTTGDSALRIHTAAFNITDEAQAQQAVERLEGEAGPVDILVNNAGIQHRVPLLELELSDWERVLRVNLTGAFVVGRAVAAHMLQRRRGKIINVASVQADLARPTIAPYTAAKGGLRNLTRAMAAEWAASGLQINALAPGYIHTEMTQNLVDDAAFNSWVVGRTPAGRWGKPEDLVGPAVWLAGEASNFVNGQTLFVDGGMTAVV